MKELSHARKVLRPFIEGGVFSRGVKKKPFWGWAMPRKAADGFYCWNE